MSDLTPCLGETPPADVMAIPNHGHLVCGAESPSRFICTAPDDHFLSSLPHVACGVPPDWSLIVIAIWDLDGHEINLATAQPGATL